MALSHLGGAQRAHDANRFVPLQVKMGQQCACDVSFVGRRCFVRIFLTAQARDVIALPRTLAQNLSPEPLPKTFAQTLAR